MNATTYVSEETQEVLFSISSIYANSKEETILGIIIDNKLSFHSCIKRPIKKPPETSLLKK